MTVTALTQIQMRRLRRKVGDKGVVQSDSSILYAFPDEELEDEWQQANGDFNTTVLALYDDLLGNAWRFHKYTQNATTEEKNQIFANLEKVRKVWAERVAEDLAAAKSAKQVRIVGMSSVPPTTKEMPEGWDTEDDGY